MADCMATSPESNCWLAGQPDSADPGPSSGCVSCVTRVEQGAERRPRPPRRAVVPVALGLGEHPQATSRRPARRARRRPPRGRRAGAARPRPAWPRAGCRRARACGAGARRTRPAISSLRRDSVKSSKITVTKSGSSRSSVLERAAQQGDEVLGRRRAAELLVEQRHAQVAVVPHDLGEELLLRAEVVVQQPARDARLAGDVVERRAGDPALGDRRAHRRDDPRGLLAGERFLGRGRRFHLRRTLAGWPAGFRRSAWATTRGSSASPPRSTGGRRSPRAPAGACRGRAT